MHSTGDRVAELDLVVRNAVPAQNHAAGFVDLLRTALQDLFEVIEIAIRGIRQQRKRGDRLAAHGVDIAQRIGRGDGAERVRIVDNGGEKIDGLHQGELRRQLVHAGIVGRVKPYQHVFIRDARNRGEHPVQNLWTQLRRSTRGFHVRGQLMLRNHTVLTIIGHWR